MIDLSAEASAVSREVRRRTRVVDMMLSMHSALRDRYARWAAIVDLLIFGGSTVLLATVLVDPRVLAYLGVSDEGARLTMGLVSTVVFLLSILALRVDWKERAGKHQRAGIVLGELKARGRSLGEQPDGVAMAHYMRLYDFAIAGTEAIPEREFLSLKAMHYRKRTLSEMIDRFPNAPILLLRWRLLRDDSRGIYAE